ncbi:hypothetical protein BBJ28_00002720 [Nothophytophthora sp. Chile5]|nr:hypothetical protein BBJ28_00002720 [Nothophytophthora sp. Chile5]
MGNALLLAAVRDQQAVALADAILPFDNLRVHEIEAYWRAFYDHVTSFALTKSELRSICCHAATCVGAPQASSSLVAEYAEAAFDLFADPSMQRRWQQLQPGTRLPPSQQFPSTDDHSAVIDALEFFSSIAFVAAIPLDEKVDLLFDSWDLSEDGALDLDEFTISLKSTLSGLAKILRPVVPSLSASGNRSASFEAAIDEDEIVLLAESAFREIASCGAASTTASKDKAVTQDPVTITCEQFRDFCVKNKRAKALFDLFEVAEAEATETEEADYKASTSDETIDLVTKLAKHTQLSASQDIEDVQIGTATSDVGDMFLAVKPWIGAIVPPSKTPPLSRSAPLVSVHLDWIFGYSAQDCKNNARYALTSTNGRAGRYDDIVFPAAAACVVLNTTTTKQRHHLAHTDEVLSLCLHPRLPLAASGEIGKQPKIIVWNLNTTETQCIMQGFHKRGVLHLAFQTPETLISIGGDDDHSIAIYESSNGWKSATLKISVKGNKAVPFHLTTNPLEPSEFVTCGEKYIEFWTLEGKTLASKKGVLGKKGTLQLFPVAEYLGGSSAQAVVVGTNDGCLYTFIARQLTTVVKAHDAAVAALFYSSGSLLSGGRDGQILQWDDKLKQIGKAFHIQDILESTTLQAQHKSIRSCCFSPDKRSILVGTQASEIYEIDAKTGQNVRSEAIVKGHFVGEVWGLDVDPLNQQCCTVGDDRTLRIWDLEAKRELKFVTLPCPARACVFSGDGKMIAVGLGRDESSKSGANTRAKASTGTANHRQPTGGFAVYSAADLTVVKEPCFDPKRWVSDVKFSPDGRTLAVASHDSNIYLYNVLKGFSRSHVFKKHSSYITHMDFSLDGNYLQSTSGGYELLFTEVKTGKHVTNTTMFRDESWHTMTSTLGWTVQGIWEPESDGTDVNALDRAKNGKLLVTGDDFGKVKIFQYPCALEKASYVELRGHAAHVTNVRWSPNDSYAVSVGGNDRCVFVWKHEKQLKGAEDDGIRLPERVESGSASLGLISGRVDDPLEMAAFGDDVGDEFMAVKPWLGAVVAPTKAKLLKVNDTSPDTRLELERVHGYQAQTASNNARYDSNGKVVYHAAALGIIFDKATQRQTFFKNHDDDVVALCAHPNGTTFASSQMGKTPKIYVWGSKNGQAVAPCLEGFHQRFVNAICFSSDGSKLGSVGGDDDHSIAIYAWESGILLSTAKGERNTVRSICYHSATKEWVTCGDKHIRFWTEQGKNLTSKKAIFGVKAHQKGKIPSVFDCVTSFGSMVISGGSDGCLYVFQSSTEVTKTVPGHEGAVQALYPTERELISGGKDSKIVIWDNQLSKVASFELKELAIQGTRLLSPEIRSVCTAQRSPRVFLVGTAGNDLLEVDAGRGQPTLSAITRGHSKMEVWGLACHPAKLEYCTVGDDQTIRVWCLLKKSQLRLQKLGCVARACALLDTADVVAIGYGGRNALANLSKAAQAKTGGIVLLCYSDLTKKLFEDRPSKQAISELKFSPDGSVLAVGSHDHKIYLYRLDPRNASKIVKAATFDKHQSYITHLDFSADGSVIQSNCGAYELLFSSAATGKQITSASSTKDTQWQSWTCTLGWPVQGIWPRCSDGTDVNAVARNSREDLLVTSDDFGLVKLYRYPCTVAHASSVDQRGHSSHVTNVRWSHNDSHVISTGGNDRCVMEWKVMGENEQTPILPEKQLTLEATESSAESEEDPDTYEESAGDEFMAVKPWIGAIVAPTNAATPNSREPELNVELEWVYGYQSELAQQNLAYNAQDEIVYHTAAVGIIYDAKSHFQKHHMGHNDDIISFALCDAKRNLIATGERGKKPVLRVWDAHTGELRCEMKDFHSRGILSLAFSNDSTRIVSVGADDDHSLALWSDASNGSWTLAKLLATGKGDKALNRFASFGSTVETIVTGGVKHVLFWSVQGKTLVSKKGIVGKQGSLQTFPSGCTFGGDFITGTMSGELYIWRGNELSKAVKAHDGEIRAVACCSSTDSAGGPTSVLISGGKDGRVVLWNAAYQSLKCFDLDALHVGNFSKAINSVFINSTGRNLLIGTCSSEIIELDVASGSVLHGGQPLFSGHFALELWGLAIHPSRREFVTVGDDRTLRVWDMDTKRVLQLRALPAKARACAYSPDSELFAVGFGGDNGLRQRRKPEAKKPQTASREGAFAIFRAHDLDTEKVVFEDRPAKEWISDVKFSPCGGSLALGSHDNGIHLYSVAANGGSPPEFKKRKPFSQHNSYITHLDFSDDSRYIQSNCGAYEYLFCETASSTQVRRASSLRDVKWATWTCTLGWPVQGIWPECADGTDVNAVCASASRTILASGDDSGNVKLFRYPCILKGVRRGLLSVLFCDSGGLLGE